MALTHMHKMWQVIYTVRITACGHCFTSMCIYNDSLNFKPQYHLFSTGASLPELP